MPWDNSKASGSITYDYKNSRQLCEVSFGKTARGDTCQVLNDISGEKLGSDYPGNTVFSMSDVTFSKTAFISSKGAAIEQKGDDEIAEKLGITSEKVHEIMKIAQDPVSLETPIGEEEDSHLGDFVEDMDSPAPSDSASYSLLREQLCNILKTLTPREEQVLKLRFGFVDGKARTLEEVGKEFEVTRERIRQIEAKALRKLRHQSRSKKLKDFVE